MFRDSENCQLLTSFSSPWGCQKLPFLPIALTPLSPQLHIKITEGKRNVAGGGAWWAAVYGVASIVHGVTKSRTWLSDFHFASQSGIRWDAPNSVRCFRWGSVLGICLVTSFNIDTWRFLFKEFSHIHAPEVDWWRDMDRQLTEEEIEAVFQLKEILYWVIISVYILIMWYIFTHLN